MLNRLVIKNYKCFEDFEFEFDSNAHSMLLLGNNGAGKTSLADALEIFQKIGRGEGQAGRLISPAQRWEEDGPVELKLSAMLGGVLFEYGFAADFLDRETRVSTETLRMGDAAMFHREGPEIFLGQGKAGNTISYDPRVLFLPTLHDKDSRDHVHTFRSWLANILILSPSPGTFKAEFAESVRWPSRDGSDCVPWLNHILTSRPKAYAGIEAYLKSLWNDFYTLGIGQVGTEMKRLRLEFKDPASKGKKEFSPALDILSDGEKCLLLSAMVLAAHEATPSLLCFWDEPDSHLSISEVGQFIHFLRDAFLTGGQLVAASHNPEVIHAFPESAAWVVGRDNHLSPVKPLKRVSDVRGSGALPKKADFVHALIAGEIRA